MKAAPTSILCTRIEVVKVEGLRKTTNNLSQYSEYMGQDLKLEPSEYEAGVVPIRPPRCVTHL
jgi:hypothetical protein